MDSLFGPLSRVALAILLVVAYLTFGFPAVANARFDGSIYVAIAGAVGVVYLAYTIARPRPPHL